MDGLQIATPERSRLEFIGRTPCDRLRALFQEPIGWTLLREEDAMAVFAGRNSVGRGPLALDFRQPSPPDIETSFAGWGLGDQTVLGLVNHWNIRGGTASPITPHQEGQLIEITWERNAPWLYQARIGRGQYILKPVDGGRVLDHARLFESERGDEAANIYWRDPIRDATCAWVYTEVELALRPVALRGLWRKRHTDPAETVAPARSIFFRYALRDVDGSPRLVPSTFEVTGEDGKTLIQMTFDAPLRSTLPDELVADPLSTLPFPEDDLRAAYYQTLKDYYRFLDNAPYKSEARLAGLPEFIRRFETVCDRAVEEKALEIELAAREEVLLKCDSVGRMAQWRDETREFLSSLEAITDRERRWRSVRRMLGHAYGNGDIPLSKEFEERLLREAIDHYSVKEALDKGHSYFPDPASAAHLFTVVQKKSLERRFLVSAALGKAGALAKLARNLERKPGNWALEDCVPYLDQAKDELAWAVAQVRDSDPEEWASLQMRAAKNIEDAEDFLERYAE